MSEEKIIQHSANAVHVLQDKQKGWINKLKEFFLEILIIVFAVSITLLFHNWNDERHERRLAREFLTGIKSDLDSGVVETQEIMNWYQPTVDYYNKTCQQITTKQFNFAYLDSNSGHLLNTQYFDFDMGRFEAFKSSGYLRLIDNQTLLKDLTDLYTVGIPFEIQADHLVFDNRRRYYDEHIGPKATFILASRDDRILVSKLVDDPYFRYFIIDYSGYLRERKTLKLDLLKQMRDMSAEIAKELAK
jgi:hypothetical protein